MLANVSPGVLPGKAKNDLLVITPQTEANPASHIRCVDASLTFVFFFFLFSNPTFKQHTTTVTIANYLCFVRSSVVQPSKSGNFSLNNILRFTILVHEPDHVIEPNRLPSFFQLIILKFSTRTLTYFELKNSPF